MASLAHFFSCSILLLEFLVIASAAEYGYSPSSENVPDIVYSSTSKPENSKYDPTPNSYGVKKPENKYELKPKSESVKPEDHAYGSKPKSESVKPEYEYESKPDHDYVPESEITLSIGIEGLVLCKSGSKYIPIEGAIAKITCPYLGHDGYEETPFNCSTGATDAKGYFFKELPHLEFGDDLILADCKVKLEKSPLKDCNVPSNVNKGVTGAVLSSYRILHDKKVKLYSVGPFFYSSDSQPKAAPNGY